MHDLGTIRRRNLPRSHGGEASEPERLPISRAIQIAEELADSAARSGPFDAGEAKGYLDALRDVAAGRIGR